MPDDAAPEIHPLLRERWSTRLFDPRHELADGDLLALLEAARWSPSAGNSQPWAFLVTRRGDDAHERFVTTLSRGNLAWVPTASAVLVSLHRVGSDEDPSVALSEYAAYDLGQAAALLTVQAQSLGLAVHQFAGFDHDQAAEIFAVPPAWKVTTGIAIGLHADPSQIEPDPALWEREQLPRVRKEIAEITHGAAFGQPVQWG